MEDMKLPFSSEFSPGVVGPDGLIVCLRIVQENEGDSAAINESLRQEFFTESASQQQDDAARLKQQLNRANNIVIAMGAYGLVDLGSRRLTDFGRELLAIPDDSERNDVFSRSILLERNGLELLKAVRTLRNRGQANLGLNIVRAQLRREGFTLSVNNGDASKVRLWLELSKVIDKNWVINERKVSALLGVPMETLEEWDTLTAAQKAFVQTLQRQGRVRGEQPIPSPELVEMVVAEHGPIFKEAQIGSKIYTPLIAGGWIKQGVKEGGRGGKGGFITPTAKTIELDLDLADTFKTDRLPADLRAALGKSLKEIRTDLESPDTYVKGIALELLAVNMAADLGLVPVGLRLRGAKTGGAEVDLIAEGAHLIYSRWIFQCKNTSKVDVSALSKEIGMATLLRCNVIVIATTGTFSSTVMKYAEQVITTTSFQVVLIDRPVLDAYARGGSVAALRGHLHSTAATALTLKGPQVAEVLEDLIEDEI